MGDVKNNKNKSKRAGEELQQSEETYRELLEQANDLVQSIDAEGKFVYVNPKWRETLGYSQKEVERLKFTDILRPDQVAHCMEVFERLMAGEAINNVETVFLTKDGKDVYVEGNVGASVKDGVFVATRGIFRDITERKKADAEIIVLSNAFRAALDPILILDLGGKVINVNEAARRLFETEELGVSALDYAVPEDREKIIAAIQGLIAGSGVNTTEFTIVTKSGRRVPIEATGSLIRDANGKANGFVVVERDITERRQAAETQQHLAAIVTSSHDAIIGKTLDGVITSWNKGAEERYGYSAEEVIGRSISVIVPPDRAEEVPQFLAKIGRGEPVIDFESERITKDGRRVTVLLTISPIKDASGRVVGASTIAQDITERKKAEVALRERLKELNCIYGISAILEMPGISLDEILKRVAMLMPSAWQFPDITEACIVLKGQTFQTARFRETSWMQASEIIVNGKPVGQIRVCYLEERQASDEGPFMAEERDLLDAIAERLGRVIERVWAEEALQQSEERYRTLFEDSIDAVVISTVEGKILDFNDSLMALTGYERDELLGLNAVKLYANPADRAMFVREIQKTSSVKEYEVKWIKKDGTEIDIVMTLTARRDEDGDIIGYQGIVRDITERRRLEVLLKRSEKRFRELADFLPQSIFEIDLEGYFTYANRYGLESTGYTLEDIKKGTLAIELFIPEQRDRVAKNMLNVLSGEKFDEHEYTILRKDGSTYPALVYTNAVMHHGKPVGIRGIVLDITERKKIEQMKTDFVSFISHQLRTPVAGLMSYIDNMLDGITGDLNSKQVEYLNEMRGVCAGNNRLIADLLNVSRLERGVLAVNINSVDLRSVVDVAVKEYSKSIEEKGLSLNIKETDQGIVVLADTDKLAEVLKNVIHNATKFTSKGSISIEIVAEGQCGIVKVSDTGMGISKMGLQNLFKKERVFDGAVVAGGGAGLGLYIAKGFMNLQHGDITAQSVEGKGSTFIISLPRK